LDLRIEFVARLREERRFASLGQLSEQLAKDCQKAVQIIGY